MVESPDIESSDEFRGEYDLAWESWLRRRLRSLCIVLVALKIVTIVVLASVILDPEIVAESAPGPVSLRSEAIFALAATILEMAVICVFHFVIIARARTPQGLIRAARLLVGVLAAIILVEPLIFSQQDLVDAGFLASIFFLHILSSLLLPWSPGTRSAPSSRSWSSGSWW